MLKIFRKRLKPAWIFAASGTVWRVVPSFSENIVCEIRDTEKKKTSFACIRSENGSVVWEKSFGEDWWIGIEALVHDVLILHRFATPDLPEHKGILAVDVLSGRELWGAEDLKLVDIRGDVLLAEKRTRSGFESVQVNLLSGATYEGSVPPAEEPEADLLSPGRAEPDSVTGNVIRSLNPAALPDGIESLTIGDVSVATCYELQGETSVGQQFTQLLYVVENESNTYRDTLGKNLSTFIPGSFCVSGRMLFYVREKRELVAVSLADSEKDRIE